MSNLSLKRDSHQLDGHQTDNEELPSTGIQRICMAHDLETCVYQYAEVLGWPIIKFSEESEAIKLLSCSNTNLFVLQEFEGELYEAIVKSAQNWILGPTAVMEIATTNMLSCLKKRPIYCLSMNGFVFFVACKGNKSLKVKLIELIRRMGGSVRRGLERNTTHMVSDTVMARGYLYAYTFQIPVMAPLWIEKSWNHRHLAGFKADCEEMLAYKLRPLAGTYVCFIGFDDSHNTHLCLLEANNGVEVEHSDPRCTHVVINEGEHVCADFKYGFVVTSDWFWESVHSGMRVDELSYLYNKFERAETYLSCRKFSTISEGSCSTFPEEEPETTRLDGSKMGTSASSDARLHSFLELVQTEKNYVNVLDIILQIKKEVTDDSLSPRAILEPTEARIIFGNVNMIADVHKMVLSDTELALREWETQTTVGHIFVKYKDDFINTYPVFANNYEDSQKMIQECENSKPAFGSILKEYQKKPECGKQHLSELLIRPIQRLGSTSLILREIHKNTSFQHPDRKELEASIKTLEDVMSAMNEDKMRTERMCVVFDVYNLIDKCPADLISSHRSLVLSFSAQQLSEGPSGRGDHLVFFLFTDIIEVAEIKNKVLASTKGSELRSPKKLKLAHGKPYKHIMQIPLTAVLRVVNVTDDNYVKNAFGLVYRNKESTKDESHYFHYLDETPSKDDLISYIVQQISNYTYELNKETLIMTVSPASIKLKPVDFAKTLSTLALKTQMFISKSLQISVLSRQIYSPVSIDNIDSPVSNIKDNDGKSVSCTHLDELKHSKKSDEVSQLKTASLKASMLKQWNNENAQ